MKAGIWRAYCILLPCIAGVSVWASPVLQQSVGGQTTAGDPCSVEQDASGDVQRWPGGIIPYVLSQRLSSDAKMQLMATMHRWEHASCTVFLPWTSQRDYVIFEPGESCCSLYGKAETGVQRVSIGNDCLGDRSIDNTLQKLIGIPKQRHINGDGTSRPTASEMSAAAQNKSTQQPTDTGAGGGGDGGQLVGASCTEMCGSCIELNPQDNSFGIITSPSYPNHYPTNLECVWKLVAPQGYTVRATFLEFDVEMERNCNYDSVDVFHLDINGQTLEHSHLCGSQVPAGVSTAGNSSEMIVIRLHSDESYAGKGFLVSYELEAISAAVETCTFDDGGCDQICVADAHGWKRRCACREGYKLAEDGQTCRDIDECARKRGGCDQRCTNTKGSFHCYCKPGFSLNPDGRTCRECTGLYNATSGTLLSPGYPAPYPPYQNCLWTIGVHPNHNLRITVETVDITPSDTCTTDFLKLEHGHFPHKRKLCGYYPKISYLLLKEESMYVRFHTEDINSYHNSGFRLSYSQVPLEDVSSLDLEYVTVNGIYVPYRQRIWV